VFALVCALAAWRAQSQRIWDDALFFQRFAHNISRAGVAAWNVADGPVHGNTSQLFQLAAVPVAAITPHHYQAAIKVWLAISLFAAFAWSARRLRGEGLAIALCGFCMPTLVLLAGSGMETLTALAALAVFFAVLARIESDRFRTRAGEAAAFAGAQLLVWLARPDACLLTGVVSAVALWPKRRRAIVLAAATLGALALLLLALRAYYGTALPLPFHVKSRFLTHYDAAYRALDAPGARRQLLTFLLLAAPFLYVALSSLRRDVVALLAGATALVVYHAVFTIEIMGYHARFFAPATLAVVLAAALAWPRFAEAPHPWPRCLPVVMLWPVLLGLAFRARAIEAPDLDLHLGWIRPREYLAFVLPTLSLFLLAPRRAPRALALAVPLVALAASLLPPLSRPGPLDDDSLEHRIAAEDGLESLYAIKRCLGETTHMFHTELGLPGVVLPDSRITDLTGLMSPRIVFDHASFDALCAPGPPDVIYLPHWTHARLNEELAAGECVKQFEEPSGPPPHRRFLVRKDLLARFEACR
jgi:hypothetical protein